MSWLSRLANRRPALAHDAPDLEATMPTSVAGRPLVTWSVAGSRFWDTLGGGRVRKALGPELRDAGLLPDAIAMVVAGRHDPHDPPFIVWAMRFDGTRAAGLPSAATALAMDAMHVDVNRGENWRDATVGARKVLVGNDQMVRQDDHHRGRPYVYLGAEALYALITDDEEWAAEVLRQLPAT